MSEERSLPGLRGVIIEKDYVLFCGVCRAGDLKKKMRGR